MVEYICINSDCENYNKVIIPDIKELNIKDIYGNLVKEKLCPSCKNNTDIKTIGAPLQMNRNIRYYQGAKNGLKGSMY